MTKMERNPEGMPYTYSLTGFNQEGILEEVFLLNEENYHPNEFQSLVIAVIGKLKKQESTWTNCTVHDVAKHLEKKFGFHRFSFYNCYLWDKDRTVICETSVRG
jgi:hypothetical protein